jgi:deoxyribonuclease V
MELRNLNRWDVSPTEAVAIQSELGWLVVEEGEPTNVRQIAGVDVGLPQGMTRAAIVVDSYPELAPVETAVAERPLLFPYVPGLLSFREAPAIIAALTDLTAGPDLIIVDGQGIAHPRRLGIASHIGLLVDLPTIGCAKSLLVGHHGPLGDAVGDWVPIEYRRKTIGAAVRTRSRVKPVYVSVGHRIGLESAIHWVLACGKGYRLPEPQRQAHRLASNTAAGR